MATLSSRELRLLGTTTQRLKLVLIFRLYLKIRASPKMTKSTKLTQFWLFWSNLTQFDPKPEMARVLH